MKAKSSGGWFLAILMCVAMIISCDAKKQSLEKDEIIIDLEPQLVAKNESFGQQFTVWRVAVGDKFYLVVKSSGGIAITSESPGAAVAKMPGVGDKSEAMYAAAGWGVVKPDKNYRQAKMPEGYFNAVIVGSILVVVAVCAIGLALFYRARKIWNRRRNPYDDTEPIMRFI